MSGLLLGGDADRGMIAAVARAHYIEGRSRVEIAEELGISRFKVARLLERGLAEGIVRIEIDDQGLPDPTLAKDLQAALGLDRCHVTRSHSDPEAARRDIGAIAAAILSETLTADEVLGIAWGRTLTTTVSQLDYLPPLEIVQLTGVIVGDMDSSPVAIVQQVSRHSGGAVHPIYAPLYVADAAVAAQLREHPDIQSALGRFPKLTTALLSVGSWDPPATQLMALLPPEDVAAALEDGCVGDIAGILIRQDGTPAYPGLQDRSINITYDQLREVPRVVAVAGGAEKANAVRVVARAGLITELVTDHTLALAILGEGS